MRLQNRVAIITGGGSGIGRATAVLFAREGAKVVVVDVDSKGGLETVKNIKKNGGEATFIRTDVTKAEEVRKMVEETVNKYNRLDILFNNAGIAGPIELLIHTNEEEWDKVIDVNLKGVFLCSKYAIPEMMKHGGGSIINTASELGLVGSSKVSPMPAYCASKGGVVLLTKATALEYAPNIRVNCICPGTVSTPLAERGIAASPDPEEARRKFIEAIPLARFAKPEEIANAVLFLASGESSYVTGAAISIDGGSTAD